MSDLIIRPISAAEARPLRQRVLRPGQPPESLVYPGDDAPATFHLGAFLDEALVGIASFYQEAPAGSHDQGAWRLRGMAVLPELQGGGYGKALLNAAFGGLTERGATLLWCNARSSAAPFYRALGFVSIGDEFDLPGIGPHYLMERPI